MGYAYNARKLELPRLRIYSFGVSALIVFSFLWLWTASQPKYEVPIVESKIVYSQFDIKYDPPVIIAPKILEKARKSLRENESLQERKENKNQIVANRAAKIENTLIKSNNSSAGASSRNITATTNGAVPKIATNSTGSGRNGTSSNSIIGDGKMPNLASSSQNTIFMQECEKAEPLERPPNCPVNTKVKKIVDINNGPRYRPERVQGHSVSEVNAKYFAGWRDRCQTNEGNQAQICISIGKKPPRVKTPQELCLEQGLSHCNGVPMPRKENTEEKQ